MHNINLCHKNGNNKKAQSIFVSYTQKNKPEQIYVNITLGKEFVELELCFPKWAILRAIPEGSIRLRMVEEAVVTSGITGEGCFLFDYLKQIDFQQGAEGVFFFRE